MTEFTAEEVRALTKVPLWQLRKCSICGVGLHYLNLQTDTPLYNPNCACTDHWTPYQKASWQDIADALNRNPAKQEQWVKELSGG